MSLVWSDAALEDLLSLYTYIAQDNPEQAQRVIETITRAADGLLTFPWLGKESDVAGLRERTLSRLPYTIVYRVVEDRRAEGTESIIEIARALHDRQNWP